MSKRKRAIRRLMSHPATEIAVGVLIVVSVVLTVIEFSLVAVPPWLIILGDLVTAIFVVELSLRAWAAADRWRFVREYWVDLLAVLPVLRVFRMGRALRLLRVLRMLRLGGLISRQATYFPYVFRRGLLEHVVILAFILVTVIFGAVGMLECEGNVNSQFRDFGRNFWWSIYTLFAGESITEYPETLAGRIIAVMVMFMGVGIFATLTGTISAFMVQRAMRMEAQDMDLSELDRHTIICGWSPKVETILRELRAGAGKDTPVVIVAQFDEVDEQAERSMRGPNVHLVNADFTTMDALEEAGVRRARTAIILSDRRNGRSEQDADARTLLAALTIERMSPRVYTCAELNNRDYGGHLKGGGVNDFVVGGEHSAILLAQAALNRGITEVVTELLTARYGCRFFKLPAPADWVGRPFEQLFAHLKREHNAILLAVEDAAGGTQVNPREHVFAQGDQLVVIATEVPVL